MKGTESFKQTIEAYLTKRASEDGLFALSFAKENKSIDECVTFILNTVRESGCCGFDDDEIYSMAVHYYDEDDIDPKYFKEVSGDVVVNHKVALSAAELEEIAQKAKDDYYRECLARQREQNKPKPKAAAKKEDVEQPSLFG